MGNFTSWFDSVSKSRSDESLCGGKPTPSPAPPSDACEWHSDTGLDGSDMETVVVQSKEECCGLCHATAGCAAADFNSLSEVHLGTPDHKGVYLETLEEDLNPVAGYRCHLKSDFSPKDRKDGSIAC